MNEVGGQAQTSAEQAGVAIGAGLSFSMIFGVWAFGALILGLMMAFTKGKKVVIAKQEVASKPSTCANL